MQRRAGENCLPDGVYGKSRYISKLFQGNNCLSSLSLCCLEWPDMVSNQQANSKVQVQKCSVLSNYFFQSDPSLLCLNLLCLAAGAHISASALSWWWLPALLFFNHQNYFMMFKVLQKQLPLLLNYYARLTPAVGSLWSYVMVMRIHLFWPPIFQLQRTALPRESLMHCRTAPWP